MHLDSTFALNYQLRILRELPNADVSRYFFPPIGTGGHDGILVEVTPTSGGSWIGQFAFGSEKAGVSAVFSLPQHEHFAVVAAGAGYVAEATHPARWKRLEIEPVRQVKVLRHLRFVLFADWTRIAAYGQQGLAWISTRLCWDDLEIVGVENGIAVGYGYDPTDSSKPKKQFAVNVHTGEVVRTEFKNLL